MESETDISDQNTTVNENSTPLNAEDKKSFQLPKAGIIVGIAALLIILSVTGYVVLSSKIGKTATTTKKSISRVVIKPTTTPVGSLQGTVIESFTGVALSDLTVMLKGPKELSTKTNKSGFYTFTEIPAGKYMLFNMDPKNKIEETPASVEAKMTSSIALASHLQNPLPSKITGVVFEDTNGNAVRDSGEKGLSALISLRKVVGKNDTVAVKNIPTDSSGNYSYDAPAQATYMMYLTYMTYYTPSDSSSFTFSANGYGQAVTRDFGYKPQVTTSGGIKIYVFNDKNENSTKDADEEHIAYQTVQITNQSTGQSWKVAVSADGYTESHLDFAHYFLALVPEDSSWSTYYKPTKNTGEADLRSGSDQPVVELGAHKLY